MAAVLVLYHAEDAVDAFLVGGVVSVDMLFGVVGVVWDDGVEHGEVGEGDVKGIHGVAVVVEPVEIDDNVCGFAGGGLLLFFYDLVVVIIIVPRI